MDYANAFLTHTNKFVFVQHFSYQFTATKTARKAFSRPYLPSHSQTLFGIGKMEGKQEDGK